MIKVIIRIIKTVLKYLLILIALAFIGYFIWIKLFYKPEGGEGKSFTDTPDRITLLVGEELSSSRYITWRCNTTLEKDSYVELISTIKETSKADSKVVATISDTTKIAAFSCTITKNRSSKTAYYAAKLAGLKTGEYRYRVVNGNKKSSWSNFRMYANRDSVTNFLYIGDIQDRAKNISPKDFKQIDSLFPKAQFWAFGGDMIQRPNDFYWDYWYNSLDSIARTIPIVSTPGNHEYYEGLPFKCDPRWQASYNPYGNGPKGDKYHSFYFTNNQICFISFDTNNCLINPFTMYYHYKWLEEIMSKNSNKWIFVMQHHPLYSMTKNRNNFGIRNILKPLYEKYNVTLVLQGHDHAYGRRATKIEINNSNTEENILEPTSPIYILSSCSPKTYSKIDAVGQDVTAVGKRLVQEITVISDTLKYNSYSVDGVLNDSFMVLRSGEILNTPHNR